MATALALDNRVSAADAYRVTAISDDAEFTDADWDGSEAEASYPNPSADDVDLDFLADHYLFAPQSMSADDPPAKAEFKAPMRMGPGGPINTNALLAIIQAINGARGGFDDVDTSTLEDGFQEAVDGLVSAGFYDDADDAPDMDIAAAEMYQFDTGDTVTWAEGTDNQAYGVIRDRATEGDDVFDDDIDGDFALSPTEDDPGYLIEVLDERDDGWVPSGTMVGHREDTLSSWSPDSQVMEGALARATGSVAPTTDLRLEADHLTSDDALGGIVWGAGDHDLSLGGEPTPVRVPEETVPDTFEALQDDIGSGDVTIGFDHPSQDSVAAKTGIVDIGRATDVSLTADGRYIALTDSELDHPNAAEAAQSGDFDDLDWSIVGDVAVRRDDDGKPVTDDGRIVLDAIRIRRIDAVNEGAVDAASIVREPDALPDLSDQTDTVRQAAADPTPQTRTAAVQALTASASELSNMQPDNLNLDPDDLDAAREQLEAAADVIDDQNDDLQAAKARASGFDKVLSAHGVDADDYDSPEAAAQAVIDEQTADIRADIAELEADLPNYDVDDVEARADDLAGNDPDTLRNELNARKAEAFDAQQSRQNRAKASAKDDTLGASDASGVFSGGDERADEVALNAMDGGDRIKAEAMGASPAEFVQQEYGLNASQYDSADDLHNDIMAALEGEA